MCSTVGKFARYVSVFPLDPKPGITVEALRGFTGMLDRSRMALFMVMFTVFIVNPLNFVFTSSSSFDGHESGHSYGTGRAILSSTGM